MTTTTTTKGNMNTDVARSGQAVVGYEQRQTTTKNKSPHPALTSNLYIGGGIVWQLTVLPPSLEKGGGKETPETTTTTTQGE